MYQTGTHLMKEIVISKFFGVAICISLGIGLKNTDIEQNKHTSVAQSKTRLCLREWFHWVVVGGTTTPPERYNTIIYR